jgi:hypothetical protein
MNNSPITPSYVFGYWRPWQENSNFFDSYLDYARDISLVRYGADTIGMYISQASNEQIGAINQLGQAIGRGMSILSNQMDDINNSLIFLNRNIDIQIEQQKLSNLLLENIAELLRVPNSEKERQHFIEKGIKHFVNSKKNPDLFEDALKNLLKAEELADDDYFVLHRIGCIYLYVDKYINPQKALDYFLRAAKYASAESDSSAARLVNVLSNNLNRINPYLNDSLTQIGFLAADSYEKAAFAAYILGRFEDSVILQSKAFKYSETNQNRFLLAKYQARNGNTQEAIYNLEKCIDVNPIFALAAFKEIDLINEPAVLNLISSKNKNINIHISELENKFKDVVSIEKDAAIKELYSLSKESYETKVIQYRKINDKFYQINDKIKNIKKKIIDLTVKIKTADIPDGEKEYISLMIIELEDALNLSLENMQLVYNENKKKFNNYKNSIKIKDNNDIILKEVSKKKKKDFLIYSYFTVALGSFFIYLKTGKYIFFYIFLMSLLFPVILLIFYFISGLVSGFFEQK